MVTDSDSHDWRTTFVNVGSTIQQAISSLETSGKKIVLVVSDDNRLVGTLTDGDIRRAFLRGLKLESGICDIIQRNPLAVPPELNQDLVLQLMQINNIQQLPIIDEKGFVVGLHTWGNIIVPKAIENMMVIMAGGSGTRLRPHTENCPKPMLEVGGKPILQHIIERAAADGFKNFVISVHYLGHLVEEHFGDGSAYGVYINYIKEEKPLGTAGCLSLLPAVPDGPIVVTNGDVLTDVHYDELLDYHNRHEATATMAVRQHEIQNPYGVVRTNGIEIDGFEEKPIYRSYVNAGIYVIEPRTLKLLEIRQHCDMPALFGRIKKNDGYAIVYPIHEPWLDVGRPADLELARNNFSNQSE